MPRRSLVRTAGYPNPLEPRSFVRDVFAWSESVTPRVVPRVAAFGAFALVVALAYARLRWAPIAVSHLQYTGAVIALLLVFRTNAGYDRWWEARRLWGGIVNQSRNLALRMIEYGPTSDAWSQASRRWVSAFPHACRCLLRGQRNAPELEPLLGGDDARSVEAAPHMPLYVAARIARMIREARNEGTLDPMTIVVIDRELSLLIDHIGACERILRTPLPLVHRIKLRRFIMLYLTALPFVVAPAELWLAPIVTMLVAYPLLAIDQIAQELESPFAEQSLSHLPLDTICKTIEANVRALP